MRNIYDLLNNVDENQAGMETMERVDMTDDEVDKVMYYILGDRLDGHNYKKKKEGKRMGWKKTVAAAVLVICIGSIGFTAGAEVVKYLAHNTKDNYKEEIAETGAIQMENVEDGVEIEIQEVSLQAGTLTFSCRFTFEGDIAAMQSCMEKWAIEEGRNAVGNAFFDNTAIYIDGKDILHYTTEDYDNGLATYPCIGEHVKFDGQSMEMMIEIGDIEGRKDQEIIFHFADLNMDDRIIEGEWDYTYEVKADAYEDNLEWHDMDVEGKGAIDTMILKEYAITPNGIQFKGECSRYASDPDREFEKDGDITITRDLRILLWDNLGNYYLMYGRCQNYKEGDFGLTDYLYIIYDGAYATQEGLANRDYKIVWDENATSVTVAVEEVISKWGDGPRPWIEDEYELVSEPFTIDLTAE